MHETLCHFYKPLQISYLLRPMMKDMIWELQCLGPAGSAHN